MFYDAAKHPEFHRDLKEDRYHIFSITKAKRRNFYPNPIPRHKSTHPARIKIGDVITIRAFFALGTNAIEAIESGLIQLEVEFVDKPKKQFFANILTLLPEEFVLAQGTTLELIADEILAVQKKT